METRPALANEDSIDRRTFVKAAAATGLELALGTGCKSTRPAAPATLAPLGPRRRYAIVGLGSRSGMYQKAIEGDYRASAQLVRICDTNPGRLELSQKKSRDAGAEIPPAFEPADFEKMLGHNDFVLGDRPRFVDFDLHGMLGNLLYTGHYRLPGKTKAIQRWYSRLLDTKFQKPAA